MVSVIMHDLGAVYEIEICAAEEQVEELKDEFDSGNSSIFAFERLISKKGYDFKTTLKYGERKEGFFA